MTLRDALRLLKEERLLVFAIIALTIVGSVTAGRIMPPDVTASAQVQVYDDAHSLALLGLTDAASATDHDVLIDTHIRLATSPTVAQRVIDRLGLAETPHTALERITVTALGRSPLLTFQATAPDADAAKTLADTWVAEYIAWRAETAETELRAASNALAPRITAVEARIAEVEARIKTGGHTKQSDTALSAAAADYEQLLADSSRLALLTSVDTPPLSIVSAAVVEEPSETLAILIDALKGLVAGAFLAVIVAFMRRRPTPAAQPD